MADGGLGDMCGPVTEKKIQEMADQIRSIIRRWNSDAPFYSMFHVDDLIVVADQNGYSVSDPKGKRATIHRFYGESFRKDA